MIAKWLETLTGISMFGDRLFRGGAAALLAGLFVFLLMPSFIRTLQRADATSDFDASGVKSPPIMGGILIMLAVLFSSVCFSLANSYSISIIAQWEPLTTFSRSNTKSWSQQGRSPRKNGKTKLMVFRPAYV